MLMPEHYRTESYEDRDYIRKQLNRLKGRTSVQVELCKRYSEKFKTEGRANANTALRKYIDAYLEKYGEL